MSSSAKPEAFAVLLASGHVRVHLDPRRPGVVLPADQLTEKYLCLDYGRNLSIPTEDVEVDGWGIRCTLSFGRKLTLTFVPWLSVYAITDQTGVGTVWQEDLPEEISFEPGDASQPIAGAVKWSN